MDIELTLKNYRSFADEHPATLRLRRGFTALVGKNNSGKSSLLRSIYELRHLFQEHATADRLATAVSNEQGAPFNGVADLEAVFCKLNSRDIEVSVTLPRQPDREVPGRVTIRIKRDGFSRRTFLYRQDGTQMGGEELGFSAAGPALLNFGGQSVQVGPLLETFSQLTRCLYIGPYRNAINVGSQEDYFDIRVGQAFIREWRQLQTGPAVRNNEAIYRLTSDIAQIFEYRNLQINAAPDDQSFQVFANGKSFRLHELGAGLTQFVLTLANAATKRPSYILIDEPELNLHPSLQMDFLTTLASYASEGILFGTHSIGLARSAGDALYALRRDQAGASILTPYESTPRLAEFVGEVSFSGSPEFGFDRILLVEGVTEVRAVQQLLRRFKKEHKILLLQMGGKALINGSEGVATQLQEVKRITVSVSALIDSERTAASSPVEPRIQSFAELCQANGVACHVLDRRAIENYFPARAIEAGVGPGHPELGHFDKGQTWRKADNWKITRQMTEDEIDGTDLGNFLAAL